MNAHDLKTLDELDVSIQHSLRNWAFRNQPSERTRARILQKAAAMGKRKAFLRRFFLAFKRMNPYWTGQPLSHTQLSQWLFSQAMLQCSSMDRLALRVVS